MRKFSQLISALAAAALVAAIAQPVQAQNTGKKDAKAQAPAKPAVAGGVVLKGQSSHPAASNFHLIFKLWAESVEKMSGGRLRIETLPAGAIVPAFEVFDAVHRGVIEVGQAPFGYILGKSLVGIPLSHGPLFGMDGMDYWAWYYDGGGMKLLEEFYRDVLKMNIVGFPIPTDYPQGMGWFKKPIKSLADLKGMKYRI
jgi:TRAP-type mannitol/chloroaromatic compound transport system substrate-binding protein